MANCITTFEGKIVDLDYCEGYAIEQHPVVDETYRVRANPSRNASSTNPANLMEGTEVECKAYVREKLAPKLDLDVNDPNFIKFYGTSKPAKTTTKKPASPPAEDAE